MLYLEEQITYVSKNVSRLDGEVASIDQMSSSLDVGKLGAVIEFQDSKFFLAQIEN